MQTAYGLQFLSWLLLYLSLFAFIKLRWPDSAPGKILATIC